MSTTTRLVVLGVVIVLAGCGVARSAGSQFAIGAISRVEAEDSVLLTLQERLADSALAIVATEFRSDVLTPAEETWEGMRLAARAEGDTLAERLTRTLESAVERTLPMAIGTMGTKTEAQVRTLSAALTSELALGVTSELAPALDSLMRGMIRSAVRGMEDDFAPATHRLMMELRDSLASRIRDVDTAVVESRTVGWLVFVLIGAGATILAGLAFGATHGWRRRSRAVEALLDAIAAGGHPGTREAAAACAREAGVHGWLATWRRTRWQRAVGPRVGGEQGSERSREAE